VLAAASNLLNETSEERPRSNDAQIKKTSHG